MIWRHVNVKNPDTQSAQFRHHVLVNPVDLDLLCHPEGDPRLIGDHDEFEAVLGKYLAGLGGTPSPTTNSRRAGGVPLPRGLTPGRAGWGTPSPTANSRRAGGVPLPRRLTPGAPLAGGLTRRGGPPRWRKITLLGDFI